jgi:pyrimidine operon attenuation protein / uracil phosphoribosyltransferase
MTLPDPNQLVESLIHATRPLVHADTGIIGIYTGGVLLAEHLHAALKPATALGTLATTFHRDDFDRRGLHREKRPTHIPFDVNGREIVLVDDVLYTGRTVRAALNEIYDFGRPRCVKLVCLLDRGGRELPIAPDVVGAHVPLPAGQMFVLAEADGRFALSLKPHS